MCVNVKVSAFFTNDEQGVERGVKIVMKIITRTKNSRNNTESVSQGHGVEID